MLLLGKFFGNDQIGTSQEQSQFACLLKQFKLPMDIFLCRNIY